MAHISISKASLLGSAALLILSVVGVSVSAGNARAQQSTGSSCDEENTAKRDKRDTLVNRISIYEKRLADAQQEVANERALQPEREKNLAEASKDLPRYRDFKDSPERSAAFDKRDQAEAEVERGKRAIRRAAKIQHDLDGYRKELSDLDNAACPTPQLTPVQHLHLIIQILKNSGQLRLAETLAATGQQTFGSTDKVDPLGVGIGLGYYFTPWNNAVRIGPFATFDVLSQTINHTFPAGTFIGTQSRWIATAGAKAGFVATPGTFFYGLAGVGLLNQDLNINFGGPVTSQNTTTPGFTAGVGGEFDLSALKKSFGVPVSAFFQYQHTWWQDAHLNQPAASPLFNYTFRREDDTIKFGLNFYFDQSFAPASPAFPVKAPALK